MSPPLLCCCDCGKRYSARKDKETRCITVSEGTCDVCGETKMVSPAYDYGGLREEWKEHRRAGENDAEGNRPDEPLGGI